MKIFLVQYTLAILCASIFFGCGGKRKVEEPYLVNPANKQPFFYKGYDKLAEGLYAELKTSKGIVVCKLEYKLAPVTVASFVGLAEGEIKNDFKPLGKPFFDSLLFYRVLPNVLIQTGDPLNNGTGGPGYTFANEPNDSLKHSSAGVLSMANSSARSNGSQFFITLKPMPYFDNKHTVFGNVVVGLDIISMINEEDRILAVQIYRKGKEAVDFDATSVPFSSIIKKN